MKQFFYEHLNPESENIFAPTPKPPSFKKLDKLVLLDDGTLDLRNGLLTSKLDHLKKARPDLTSLKDFVEEVSGWS